MATDFQTIHAGQHEVEDEQIRVVLPHQAQGNGTVHPLQALKSRFLEVIT
jgi:hypothetical protein